MRTTASNRVNRQHHPRRGPVVIGITVSSDELPVGEVGFRYEHRKSDISLFDAVGYVFALKKGHPFVTGDKEFEHLEGVEFKKGNSYS